MTLAVAGAGRSLSGHPSHYHTTVCAAEVHPAPPPLTCLLARCLLGSMDEDGAMPFDGGKNMTILEDSHSDFPSCHQHPSPS